MRSLFIPFRGQEVEIEYTSHQYDSETGIWETEWGFKTIYFPEDITDEEEQDIFNLIVDREETEED